MKKTIRQPLVLGTVLGLLAGIATATGLSFLISGITDNAIGFYVTLLLLAAALGGPLAGAIAAALFVIILALFGSPELKEIITIPAIFWSNLFSLVTVVALVGLAYRWIYERVKMPARLLLWSGIVIIYYVISIPASIIPQYFLLGSSIPEIPSAVLDAYTAFASQAVFDIFITSLVFIALPKRYRRPLWIEPKKVTDQTSENPVV